MNVGDLVIVTSLGNYNPTYAEVVPFVGKIEEKDSICYNVRSTVTNKVYELYPDQVSIFNHQGIEFNPESTVERVTPEMFTCQEAYENRRSNWQIWGCKLFDNEVDARKVFG